MLNLRQLSRALHWRSVQLCQHENHKEHLSQRKSKPLQDLLSQGESMCVRTDHKEVLAIPLSTVQPYSQASWAEAGNEVACYSLLLRIP